MEKKIKGIIRRIGDIGEKVSRMLGEKKPPVIEIDIVLEDIRTLYEEVKTLQMQVSGSPVTEKPAASAGGKGKEAPVTDPGETAGEAAVTDPGETAGDVAVADQADTSVEVSTARETAAGKKKKAGRPAGGEKSPKTDPGPSILADKYKDDKKLIYESLGGTEEKKDISSKMQSQPISNIGTALGINERFQLIKDLFNGDKASFENTINKLDAAANFNEAFNYINSSFDWDMEEDSVQLLLELVRRKFIVNKNE